MNDFTKEQIKWAADLLPYEIHKILSTSDIERKVQKIGVEAGLLIDQMKTLSGIANFAILGLFVGKDIEAEIKNSLEITEPQSKEIAEKVSTEILKPINELKVKVLAEEKLKRDRERLAAMEEENERIEEDNEARWAGEEKKLAEDIVKETDELSSPQSESSEYSSEALIEIQPPKQAMLLEKAPDIAPENLPIEKVAESFLPYLIPKVTPPDSVPVHPFEEKMKQVFTSTPAEIGNIALAPLEKVSALAQILPEQNLGEQTPPAQTNTPSIPPAPATGNLRHDPYREATE